MENEKEYEAWKAQIEQEVKVWNEIMEKIESENAVWKARWPQYCRICGGWGMTGAPDSTPEDPGLEPCEAFGYDNRCHRCGGQLVDDCMHRDPYCEKCGWSWDDGLQGTTY